MSPCLARVCRRTRRTKRRAVLARGSGTAADLPRTDRPSEGFSSTPRPAADGGTVYSAASEARPDSARFTRTARAHHHATDGRYPPKCAFTGGNATRRSSLPAGGERRPVPLSVVLLRRAESRCGRRLWLDERPGRRSSAGSIARAAVSRGASVLTNISRSKTVTVPYFGRYRSGGNSSRSYRVRSASSDQLVCWWSIRSPTRAQTNASPYPE